MAAVTGELTLAPGLVLAVGPADLAAGVAHAAGERAPVLVLCEAPGEPSGAGEASGAGMSATRAVAGAKAWLPVAAGSAGHWIAHAGRLAMTEPPGPVVLTLGAGVAAGAAVPVATRVHPDALPPPDAGALDAAAAQLVAARRPVLVVGRQCRTPGTAPWIRALAEALPAPVLVTPKARGVLPDPHPLALGTVTSLSAQHPVLARADLIVALGLDAIELAEPGDAVPILRFTRAPGEAGPADAAPAVVGEISLILEELASRLRSRQAADWDVSWLDRMKRRAGPADTGSLSSGQVVRIARDATPAGAIATADREVMAVVASVWDALEPGELLVATSLAIDGFAVPAAIAARLARPGVPVIGFTSVAGLLASTGALRLARDRALPLVLILFAPAGTDAGGAAAVVDGARALGLAVRVATSAEDLARLLEQAEAGGAPTLIEARARPVTEGL
jgi:acetolactate synthase-1/2/3 large subunit